MRKNFLLAVVSVAVIATFGDVGMSVFANGGNNVEKNTVYTEKGPDSKNTNNETSKNVPGTPGEQEPPKDITVNKEKAVTIAKDLLTKMFRVDFNAKNYVVMTRYYDVKGDDASWPAGVGERSGKNIKAWEIQWAVDESTKEAKRIGIKCDVFLNAETGELLYIQDDSIPVDYKAQVWTAEYAEKMASQFLKDNELDSDVIKLTPLVLKKGDIEVIAKRQNGTSSSIAISTNKLWAYESSVPKEILDRWEKDKLN